MSNNKQQTAVKKITILLMLLVSLATANAQSFSKVKFAYSNKCNVYTFEMEGTSDTTCFRQTIYITTINYGPTLLRTYSRTFQFTFPDTGTYEWIANVRNVCLPFEKRDTVIYGRIRVTCMPENCKWASVNIEEMSSENYFMWRITGDAFKDTCVKYDYNVTDLSTNKVLTNLYKYDLFPRVYLPHKGKYLFGLKLTNKCTGCDTTIYDSVDYHYYTQCVFNYKMLSTYDSTCIDSFAGEMTKGTLEPPSFCWRYSSMLLCGGTLNKFTDDQWAHDSTIFNNGISYAGNDVVYETNDTLDAGRKLNYKFRKPGRYLLMLTWSHYCAGDDTVILIRFTIDPCVTLKTEDLTITNRESKVIGVYDMLGRPAKHIRKEEIMILLYDNGSTKKVIQQ